MNRDKYAYVVLPWPFCYTFVKSGRSVGPKQALYEVKEKGQDNEWKSEVKFIHTEWKFCSKFNICQRLEFSVGSLEGVDYGW